MPVKTFLNSSKEMSLAHGSISSTKVTGCIAVSPTQLVFPLTGAYLEIEVSNVNDMDWVTWKLKTNRPERYLVRPKIGILGPGGTVIIGIELPNSAVPAKLSSLHSDRFLVLGSAWKETGNVPKAGIDKKVVKLWKLMEKKHHPRLSKYAYQVITIHCKIGAPPAMAKSRQTQKARHTYSVLEYQKLLQFAASFQKRNNNLEARITLEKEKTERLEATLARLKNKIHFNAQSDGELHQSRRSVNKSKSNWVSKNGWEDRWIRERMGSDDSGCSFCGRWCVLLIVVFFCGYIWFHSVVTVSFDKKTSEEDSTMLLLETCFLWDSKRASEPLYAFLQTVSEIDSDMVVSELYQIVGLLTEICRTTVRVASQSCKALLLCWRALFHPL